MFFCPLGLAESELLEELAFLEEPEVLEELEVLEEPEALEEPEVLEEADDLDVEPETGFSLFFEASDAGDCTRFSP